MITTTTGTGVSSTIHERSGNCFGFPLDALQQAGIRPIWQAETHDMTVRLEAAEPRINEILGAIAAQCRLRLRLKSTVKSIRITRRR